MIDAHVSSLALHLKTPPTQRTCECRRRLDREVDASVLSGEFENLRAREARGGENGENKQTKKRNSREPMLLRRASGKSKNYLSKVAPGVGEGHFGVPVV